MDETIQIEASKLNWKTYNWKNTKTTKKKKVWILKVSSRQYIYIPQYCDVAEVVIIHKPD